MKKKIFGILIFSVLSFQINAEVYKIEDFVSEKNFEILKKDGMINYVHPEEELALKYLPSTDFDSKINENRITKGPISYVTEYLYYLPKEMLLKDSKKSELKMEDIEYVFRAISKMEGMRYHFSAKRPEGKDVLYKKVYNISDPTSNQPIPDVLEGDINGLETYCLQLDHTYGDIRYKLNYYKEKGILYCTFLNKSPMGLLGINAVKNDSLRINIIAVDCGDSILLYMHCDVACEKVALFNVRKKISESMADRMEAIYKWFVIQFK